MQKHIYIIYKIGGCGIGTEEKIIFEGGSDQLEDTFGISFYQIDVFCDEHNLQWKVEVINKMDPRYNKYFSDNTLKLIPSEEIAEEILDIASNFPGIGAFESRISSRRVIKEYIANMRGYTFYKMNVGKEYLNSF